MEFRKKRKEKKELMGEGGVGREREISINFSKEIKMRFRRSTDGATSPHLISSTCMSAHMCVRKGKQLKTDIGYQSVKIANRTSMALVSFLEIELCVVSCFEPTPGRYGNARPANTRTTGDNPPGQRTPTVPREAKR